MAAPVETAVSVALLRSLLRPDFEAGVLYWLPRPGADLWNARFAGQRAGRINSAGHRQIIITIGEVRYHSVAHRVLWAMREGEWPSRDIHIDHKLGERDDNRASEVRDATQQQNNRNRLIGRNNTSGFKGVSWAPREERWIAQISINKKAHYLGYFKDKVLAATAYDAAATNHFGEFARTNKSMGLL